MKTTSKITFLLSLWACAALAFLNAKPVPIIFDTDMGNDVDDALALAMAHSLQSLGECEILAVSVNKDNPYAGVFCDIINTFYGRSEIPIGTVKNSGVTPDAGHFAQIASERRDTDGRFTYERRATPDTDLPDATRVLRQALANAEDHSVVFVVIGFSSNMDRLLKSPADDISPLTGKALMAKKGKFVSIMAGDFSKEKTAEWNVRKDAAAARDFYRDCPIPMIFSGLEVGREVMYPWASIQNDYGWAEKNPVIDAYKLFRKGKPHDRPCWDMFSLLYAVRPQANICSLSEPGKVAVIDEKGVVEFTPQKDGLHRCMTIDQAQKGEALKAFLELSTRARDNTAK